MIQDTKCELLIDGVVETAHVLNVEGLLDTLCEKQTVAGVVNIGFVKSDDW